MKSLILAGIAAALMASAPSFAGPLIGEAPRHHRYHELNNDGRGLYNQRHDGVDRRQAEQQQRIEQGLRSGELTWHEARQLRAEQRRIRAEERAFKSDGILTREERWKLNRDLDAASRHIYEQKHDNEWRY